jgi:aminoglycoside phosphotransferase (APT) family kinase protein
VKDGLARLVDALSPGATPVSLRRLKGGLGAQIHLLRYETAAGERRSVVLRRYRPGPGWRKATAENARLEFNVLQLLEQAEVPASKPVLLDADGAYFGVPALVLSYIPGRSFIEHRNEGTWVDGLAQALVRVHSVTPQRFDVTWLRRLKAAREQLNDNRDRISTPLERETYAMLEKHLDAVTPLEPCLVHDDYWPGNTVWFRGRLAAVIDWGDAGIGDPRTDVSQCRTDLVFSHGVATADAFQRCYEAASPRPLPDMWYFDALLGLRALLNYPKWLEGYHDAGMRHLELADVGARLEAFVRRALDEAP